MRPVLAGYRKSWSMGTSSTFRAVVWRREVTAENQGPNQSHRLSPTLCSSAVCFHPLASGGENPGRCSEQTYGSSRSKKRTWKTGSEGRRPDSADVQTQINCSQKRIFLAASITPFPFSFPSDAATTFWERGHKWWKMQSLKYIQNSPGLWWFLKRNKAGAIN